VWRLIVRQAMTLAAAGILLGVAGALYLARVMSSLLFGVGPRDPVIFAVVPLLFAVVALVAACVPARTATRISPVTALRSE
jgi:ABC-type antimicrobial peptide transport system permease subunit